MTRMEDWVKSYDDFYINPKKEKKNDDLLREVVGDFLNDKENKQLLDE